MDERFTADRPGWYEVSPAGVRYLGEDEPEPRPFEPGVHLVHFGTVTGDDIAAEAARHGLVWPPGGDN